ncbi:hypothetical protein ACFOY2_29345 [Nonomuraea purpurea]|uniref:Uncharacterized protein n=1 Tax=Nonomuraea purpurea TaxID=1849276 RepID=A0ABV8GF72_9ACTN
MAVTTLPERPEVRRSGDGFGQVHVTVEGWESFAQEEAAGDVGDLAGGVAGFTGELGISGQVASDEADRVFGAFGQGRWAAQPFDQGGDAVGRGREVGADQSVEGGKVRVCG